MNFRVGQEVLCIHGGPWWEDGFVQVIAGVILPQRGAVYTIRSASLWRDEVYIRLKEIINQPCLDGSEASFHGEAFRPVVKRKTDISVFRKLLTPAPTRELV